MTTPIDPDALWRVPVVPQPHAPVAGILSSASFARALRPRALVPGAEVAAGAPQADEADADVWLSVNWMHAAFLARQSMEQAFAVLRGDEA
jgi:hypothetical protein